MSWLPFEHVRKKWQRVTLLFEYLEFVQGSYLILGVCSTHTHPPIFLLWPLTLPTSFKLLQTKPRISSFWEIPGACCKSTPLIDLVLKNTPQSYASWVWRLSTASDSQCDKVGLQMVCILGEYCSWRFFATSLRRNGKSVSMQCSLNFPSHSVTYFLK